MTTETQAATTPEAQFLARARQALTYDSEAGVFRWVASGKKAGSPNAYGYQSIQFERRHYMAHRLAWLLTHGAWPVGVIDHLNGDRSDNRLVNLRDVSIKANLQNQRAAKCTSHLGVLGVSKNRAGFRARIRVADRQIGLGTFKTLEEASSAYLTAKRKLHAGNTL